MKKSSFLFSSFVCFTVLPNLLLSLPKNPAVVSGDVAIENSQSHQMVIKASHKSIIDYHSFDIDKGEKVKFIQPSSSSAVLNRVKGKKASQILGQMESNGKVILINPNGMYFGPHASVRVASLVASTLDLSNEDFIRDQYSFLLKNKESLSEIRNDGCLSASPEGAIVLMAPVIRNFGTIQAKAGKVVLASGEKVTLDFHGDGLFQFAVEGDIKGSIIEHLGTIQAADGQVYMHLPTAKRAIHEVVNKEGVERGEVFVKENGEIFLVSSSSILAKQVSLEGSTLSIDGNIDVSSRLEKGGEIRLAGAEISIRGSRMDASGMLGGGDVFIGGEYQGGGSMPYASKVLMDSDSHILSNAIEEGNGGTVVLWSLEETRFDGNIFAQGGFQGGNGGMIETSSLDNLIVSSGFVNSSAPSGTMGQWLLDPGTINITASAGANPGCVSSGSYTVNVATLEASSTDVILCANEIFVEVPISMSSSGVGIVFTAPSGQEGVLYLSGGSIVTIGGGVAVKNLSTILSVSNLIDTTGGGSYPVGADILLGSIDASGSGVSLVLASGVSLSTVYDIGLNTPLNNLSITSAKQALVNNVILDGFFLSSSSVLLQGDAAFNIGGSITLKSLDSILSGTGNLTINAGGAISMGGIGVNVPLNSISILSAAPGIIVGSIFTQNGNIDVVPSMELIDPVTVIKTYSDLNTYLSGAVNLGDITVDISEIRSLEITLGLRGSATIGNIGTPEDVLAALSIELNHDLTIGDIYASGIVIIEAGAGIVTLGGETFTTGANGFSVTGGGIVLGGEITAPGVSLITTHSISNATVPNLITVTDSGRLVLNALKQGSVGTQASPIEVDTQGPIAVGGSEVWLSGTYSDVTYFPNNKPCLLLLKGRLLPCLLARRPLFDLFPKVIFRNFFFNSFFLGIGYPLPPQFGAVQDSHFAPIEPRSDWRLPALSPI